MCKKREKSEPSYSPRRKLFSSTNDSVAPSTQVSKMNAGGGVSTLYHTEDAKACLRHACGMLIGRASNQTQLIQPCNRLKSISQSNVPRVTPNCGAERKTLSVHPSKKAAGPSSLRIRRATEPTVIEDGGLASFKAATSCDKWSSSEL